MTTENTSKNDFSPTTRAILYVVVLVVFLVALAFKVITFDNLSDLLESALLVLGIGSAGLARRNVTS